MQALIDLMKRENLTQEQIASMIGKTQATISGIITGKSGLQPEDARILIEKFPKSISWEACYARISAKAPRRLNGQTVRRASA